MELYISHSTNTDRWLQENHYLHTTPAGAVIRMEFRQSNQIIGAMMWGRNTSPRQDQKNVLCLTRMYFLDKAPKNTESHALALARKYIRKHHPEIKGLVAYSSTGQGHEGIVYQADGWFEVSRSRTSRDCREGRRNLDTSAKIKWVRSP